MLPLTAYFDVNHSNHLLLRSFTSVIWCFRLYTVQRCRKNHPCVTSVFIHTLMLLRYDSYTPTKNRLHRIHVDSVCVTNSKREGFRATVLFHSAGWWSGTLGNLNDQDERSSQLYRYIRLTSRTTVGDDPIFYYACSFSQAAFSLLP